MLNVSMSNIVFSLGYAMKVHAVKRIGKFFGRVRSTSRIAVHWVSGCLIVHLLNEASGPSVAVVGRIGGDNRVAGPVSIPGLISSPIVPLVEITRAILPQHEMDIDVNYPRARIRHRRVVGGIRPVTSNGLTGCRCYGSDV